jgi:tRNA A-37 threonylcarbamoyl transferase component Bud32
MEPLAADDPERVAGYRLRGRLGAGGMGRVYLAFTDGGRAVALKVIRPEFGDDRDFRERFRLEVEAARRVHGLYTAQVLDADPAASPPWLVTAYVPGPSLAEAVRAHGPLPVSTALLLMGGVAEALAAIHAAGLVHRDLKPSNVLLSADGPRVIDFGIARAIEATKMTRTGIRVGTPSFMAPEQAEGDAVSPAIDVFALGSVIAFAVLGREPFGTGQEQVLLYRIVHMEPDLGGCPEPLRGLVARCLAKSPGERPSAGEIIAECRAHTAGQTIALARSWLPAAVSEGLARYAPPLALLPTAPPSVPVGPPGVAPAAAAAPLGAPAAAGAAAPPALSSAPGPFAPAFPLGPAVSPGPPAPPSPLASPAPYGWAPATPARPGRQRWVIPAFAGVAIVAAIGAGTAVALALHPGSASSGGPGSNAGAGSATSPPVTATGAAAGGSPGPSASPGACLVGTWRDIDQQVLDTSAGTPVLFTGSGGMLTASPNGTYTESYDNVVLTASSGVVHWTSTLNGTESGDWAVNGGQLQISNASSGVTEVLTEDGAYAGTGRLTVSPVDAGYTCSGNTFIITFPQGGSDHFTRVSSLSRRAEVPGRLIPGPPGRVLAKWDIGRPLAIVQLPPGQGVVLGDGQGKRAAGCSDRRTY